MLQLKSTFALGIFGSSFQIGLPLTFSIARVVIVEEMKVVWHTSSFKDASFFQEELTIFISRQVQFLQSLIRGGHNNTENSKAVLCKISHHITVLMTQVNYI